MLITIGQETRTIIKSKYDIPYLHITVDKHFTKALFGSIISFNIKSGQKCFDGVGKVSGQTIYGGSRVADYKIRLGN